MDWNELDTKGLDNYIAEKDSPFLTDIESGQKMIYLIDHKKQLVIRSMMKLDVPSIVNSYCESICADPRQGVKYFSNNEKRQLRRELYQTLDKENSQFFIFVIEEIIGPKKDNLWYSDYTRERSLPFAYVIRTKNNSDNDTTKVGSYFFDKEDSEDVHYMIEYLQKNVFGEIYDDGIA